MARSERGLSPKAASVCAALAVMHVLERFPTSEAFRHEVANQVEAQFLEEWRKITSSERS